MPFVGKLYCTYKVNPASVTVRETLTMVVHVTLPGIILTFKIVTKGVLLYKALKKISAFSNQVTIVFDELDGQVYNEIYKAAEIYLGNKIYSENRRFKVSKPEKNFKVRLDHKEKVKDVYDGHKFKWVWLDSKGVRSNMGRCFELTFHKKHKDLAFDSYLPYITKEANHLRKN